MTIEQRRKQAYAWADQLGLDGEQVYLAAEAVWSNINPDSKPFGQALSLAGVALRAAERREGFALRFDLAATTPEAAAHEVHAVLQGVVHVCMLPGILTGCDDGHGEGPIVAGAGETIGRWFYRPQEVRP